MRILSWLAYGKKCEDQIRRINGKLAFRFLCWFNVFTAIKLKKIIDCMYMKQSLIHLDVITRTKILTEITVAQNEVELSYHRVRGLDFLGDYSIVTAKTTATLS